MKFAPIVPTNGLRVLERVGIGYHFALGQELLRDQDYFKYYRALGRLGHFIIVDNGAAERDTPPFEKIVEVALKIKAAEIILPDVLEDMRGTQNVIRQCQELKSIPVHMRMIVPQGKTIEEWATCLETFVDVLGGQFRSVGIPKHLEKNLDGGRATILKRFVDWYPRIAEESDIHLLGVWHDPFREISAAAAICDIRGIDSGVPIAWAQRSRLLLPESMIEDHLSMAWHVPFDLDIGRKNVWNIARYAAEYD